MRIIRQLFPSFVIRPAGWRHLLAAGLFALFTTTLADAEARYDFDARVATVDALIAAGVRLDTGRNVARMFDIVGQVLDEARGARRTGDEALAYRRLDQAYALVQVIVRRLAADPDVASRALVAALPNSGDSTAGDRRHVQLQGSVAALAVAYRAIRDEQQGTVSDIEPQVRELVTLAEQERIAGRNARALRRMKEAYALLQSEIVRLRGGQTLVRELRLGSVREEYEYAVDRHDAHLLLIELLLDAAGDDPGADEAIRTAVNQSMRLDWVAHKHASAGDYRQAVAWLEQSSETLVMLMRGHGHNIPN